MFKYFQEAISIELDFVDVYIIELGNLMFEIGELNSAKKCYKDALILEPRNSGIKNNLDKVNSMLS